MNIDFDRLFKLRLVIARYGEMDLAKWWNTKGQLGRVGAAALRRGFPRTHYFAQARSVFAVAAQRCAEVFDPPQCATLWRLPESVEEEFDAHWEQWIDTINDWSTFFSDLAALQTTDLSSILTNFGLVTSQDIANIGNFRRSSEGRSVPLPGMFSGNNSDVAMLALGFRCSEVGALAVPYLRLT